MREWHRMSAGDALKALESGIKGLSDADAAGRLRKYGYNELQEKKKKPAWVLFLNQFRNVLVIILIIASVISAILREFLDATAIILIVILNAILGFRQESKAEKALEALKKLASKKAQVVRSGEVKTVEARELVPGDIITLNVGDKIPADSRILEEFNLKADESVLTGESVPVEKSAEALKDAPVAERHNMLFSGTTIVYGHCTALVTETAMKTEFGKIASLLQQEETERTPLQAKLEEFGKHLGFIILAVSAIVFAAGYLQGRDILEMFLTAVSLAVAAIPEGLPAVVTITLAIGLLRMAKRNVIVRKLPSVETLGSTTVIASDKTGTLTVNQMTVRKLYVNDEMIDVTGSGYEASGKLVKSGKEISIDEGVKQLLTIGLLCNDAKIGKEVIGDPTEAALLVSAEKAKLPDLREKYKRVAEAPFDSERKMMSVVCETEEGTVMYTKGAVEEILKRCNGIYSDGKVERLTEDAKKRIVKINEQFAKDALRVLAFAMKKPKEKHVIENDLVFVGLQAMIDPPRPEVKGAIERCKEAGINVIMITGDHRDTAVAVANELDMLGGKRVLTGSELDKMNEEEYMEIVEDVAVYARVSPEHKVRITEALKKKGHVVAMTGDGVNDAPALKKADIGIAMGITGTDVTKEAGAMVLTDDNFASIVAAVEEGRGIFDNIRKFVNYLLSANIGEILIVFLAIMFIHDPKTGFAVLPLLPIQLLWINLVTDGLPALALGMETVEKDIMKRKPRDPREKVMNREAIGFIIFVGVLMAAATLFQFYIELSSEGIEKARTVAFTTVVIVELFIALAARSYLPLHKVGVFTNRKLLLAILSSVALQLVVIYTPFLNPIFDTVPIAIEEWLGIFAVSFGVFAAIETRKILKGRKSEPI